MMPKDAFINQYNLKGVAFDNESSVFSASEN